MDAITEIKRNTQKKGGKKNDMQDFWQWFTTKYRHLYYLEPTTHHRVWHKYTWALNLRFYFIKYRFMVGIGWAYDNEKESRAIYQIYNSRAHSTRKTNLK